LIHDTQRNHVQEVGNQQQPYPLELLKHLVTSSLRVTGGRGRADTPLPPQYPIVNTEWIGVKGRFRLVLTLTKEGCNKFQVVPKLRAESPLYPLLKSVSRSFYLTLAILPHNVRPQMALAYLYARAADSIADSRLMPREHRLQHLVRFRQWIGDPEKNGSVLREMQESLS